MGRSVQIGVYADEWHCGSGLCSTLMVNLLKKNSRAPPEGSACLICGIRQFVSLLPFLADNTEIRSKYDHLKALAAVVPFEKLFHRCTFSACARARGTKHRARKIARVNLALSPFSFSREFKRNDINDFRLHSRVHICYPFSRDSFLWETTMFLRPQGTAPADLHIETANTRIRFNNASRRLDLFRSKSRGTVAESRSVNSDTLLYRAELSILLYCSPFPGERVYGASRTFDKL